MPITSQYTIIYDIADIYNWKNAQKVEYLILSEN